MATANYARRRRNAILAAIVMALIFIIIVVLIVVSVVGKGNGNKNNKPTQEPTKTTAMAVLPTIPVVTQAPDATDDPFATDDPTATDSESTASPTATAPQEAGTIMYVTGDGVNVRKAATSDSDKLTSLSKGTAVTAYDKVGDFYSVKLSDGKLGYISAKFLSEDDPKKADVTPTAKPTSTPDTSKGVTKYVNADKVNVRASGSSSADKLASLVKGKEVVAYQTVGDWTYIRYGTNKYGYISTKYLSDSIASPSATPTATSGTPKPTASATVTATPTPTSTPAAKSFTKYDVPAAVAKVADAQTKYLNAATGNGGWGTVGNTNYIIITTDVEINGQKRFFICYEGTDEAPTNIKIQSTMPAAQ